MTNGAFKYEFIKMSAMKNFRLYFCAILFLLIAPFQLSSVIGQYSIDSFMLHQIKVRTPEDLMNLLHYNNGTFPVVCGHRGGAQLNYPENCINTFENTIKYTYSVLECDPRYTRDSAIVLHHDPTLERTTNGKGRVIDYSLAELKELKLKDPKGNITEYHMPTLDEALEWAKGKAILLLDQKDVMVEARIKKVEEHNAIANVILTIYNFDDAKLCYKLNRNIMMQVFIHSMEKALEFEKTGVPWKNIVASVGHKVPTDSVLYKYIHQKGAICTAASMETIDRKFKTGEVKDFSLLKNDYSGFLSIGVDMIQTDLPASLGPLLYGLVPVLTDVKPVVNISSPASYTGYLQQDTVFVKVIAQDYGDGKIENLQVYLDEDLITSSDLPSLDTTLRSMLVPKCVSLPLIPLSGKEP